MQEFWTPHFTAVRGLRELVISYPVWLRKLKFGQKKNLPEDVGSKLDPRGNLLSQGQGSPLLKSDLKLKKF